MKKEIVFCDPHQSILDLYKMYFEHQASENKYKTRYFTSVIDAEKYVSQHSRQVGIFVSSLHIKPKNGYEVARSLLEKHPNLPVVIMTTDVLSGLAIDAGNLTNVLYVDKKENIKELKEVADFLLVNLPDMLMKELL